MLSKQAYEDYILTVKGAPILYEDKPIGVMTGENEGYLFAECVPEIIVNSMHKEGDICVIDSCSFSAVSITKLMK
jgi:hypothetical protein